MINNYIPLHVHSVYSVLDGFAQIPDIVKRSVELKMPSICVSDHGSCGGHYELNKEAKKAGIKPIFANELYIAPSSGDIKTKIDGYKYAYHLLIIAKNNTGYQNLLKITERSFTHWKYYKPRTTFEDLMTYREGLIVTSACLGGYPSQMLLEGRDEEAEDVAIKFKNIFGSDYYLELTYTGLQEQIIVNEKLRAIARKNNIPLIITPDSHYAFREDSEKHRALICININKPFTMKSEEDLLVKKEGEDLDSSGMFYQPFQYYLKSFEEMREIFPSDEDLVAFQNTMLIADQCNVDLVDSSIKFPKHSDTSDEDLNRETSLSLALYLEKNPNLDSQIYYDRLNEELGVIRRMGFSSYFLVVKDYISFAKESNIMVGPGRGSAAGSLVNFLCGNTYVDPIEYGLLFGRMLNRGRGKFPLIEIPELSIESWRAQGQK
jgi:DNA polymerase-3 subunit alpha